MCEMAITSQEDLEKKISLSPSEKKWFLNKGKDDLKFLVPTVFENMITISSIRNQFVPKYEELEDSSFTLDPQNEEEFSVYPHLVHRYQNRVALKLTDKCFGYCRYCFRRRFTSHGDVCSFDEIEKVASYLKEHSEVEEILLTGGDPLTLSNEVLSKIFETLRCSSSHLIIRLCTRALGTNPFRFDDGLFEILYKHNNDWPVFLMTQFNSYYELTEEAKTKAKLLNSKGILMFNQSVLLKGVNDSAEELKKLSRVLLENRIKPYYIFQPDDVKGTKHFALTNEDAFKIEKELRVLASGLEMPVFTKDLPNGEGKVPLSYLVKQK